MRVRIDFHFSDQMFSDMDVLSDLMGLSRTQVLEWLARNALETGLVGNLVKAAPPAVEIDA